MVEPVVEIRYAKYARVSRQDDMVVDQGELGTNSDGSPNVVPPFGASSSATTVAEASVQTALTNVADDTARERADKLAAVVAELQHSM